MDQTYMPLGSIFQRRNGLWLLLVVLLILLLFTLNKTISKYTASEQLHADTALFELMKATAEVLHDSQRERGFTTGFLIHDIDIDQSGRGQYWLATDNSVATLKRVVEQLDTSIYAPRFKVAIQNIETISHRLSELRVAVEESRLSGTQAFDSYTDINRKLLEIAGDSIFYLADAELAQRLSGFLNLLHHQELMGQERAILIDAFALGRFEPGLFRRFIAVTAEEKKYLELFLFLSDRETGNRYYEITASDDFTQAKRMRQRAIDRAQTGGFGIDPNEWWVTQTACIDHYYSIGGDVLKTVQRYLQQRKDSVGQQLQTDYLLIALSLLAIVGLMMHFLRTVRSTAVHGQSLTQPKTTLTTLAVIVLLLLMTIGTLLFFSYNNISTRLKEQVLGTMSDLLNSSHETLHEIWLKSVVLEAESWAANPLVVTSTEALLGMPLSSAVLSRHPAQKNLRFFFTQQLNSYYQKGIFVVSQDYHNLSSMRDTDLGKLNFTLDARPEALAEALAGKTTLVLPLPSDVPLRSEKGLIVENWPTMFIATPIFDESGAVLAALMIRIDPFDQFSQILTKDQLWNSGETYAFDGAGRMLTRSRFEDQLQDMGLLDGGQSSILNIEIREPSEHQVGGHTLGKAPLTLMAQRAVLGQNGRSKRTYPDYRGIPVIGVWLWDAELGMGLVTEVDESEVLASIRPIGNTMISGFVLVAFISVLALLFFYRIQKKSFSALLGSMAEIKHQQSCAEESAVRLQEAQAQFKAVVDNTADSIVVIDKQGIINSVNPALIKMFGYQADELLGENVNILMPEPYYSEHGNYIVENYLKSGKTGVIGTNREVFARHADATTFPVELMVSEFLLGDELHFAGTLRDISERKKAEDELVRAREEAEAANLAKSTFLATMSHEIRTPLNGVVGGIDMLAHTSLEQHQRDLIHTAQDSAVILQTVIDDTLDFSKIEAGHLELEELPLSFELLMESFGESLRPLAQQKGCELLTYCDPQLPEVLGDSVRIKQILFNLTGNAIKFSATQAEQPGKVMVSVSLLAEGAEHVDLCCRVCDNGIGMGHEVQQRLFTPFMQGEEDTTRRFGGTGLGLVISQRLVELMGGYIEVQSEAGQGSTFSVFLSLPKNASKQLVNEHKLSGIRVLLIQSNADVVDLLVSYLEHADADVFVVKTEQALQHYRDLSDEQRPDVIVIDNPNDNEFSPPLCEQIRNESHDANLRFLIIARGQRRYARPHKDDAMTLDLNVMRRITFINAVAAVAGREPPHQGPSQQRPSVVVDSMEYTEAIAAGRLVLLADDNEINRKVIGQQLNMLGYAVDFAEDGEEAFKCWEKGAYNLLMMDCHMPKMDGYQLARNIRHTEKPGKRVPIIAVTADAMKGTSRKCYLAGMDDYMTKPMQLSDLDEILAKWLPEAALPILGINTDIDMEINADNVNNAHDITVNATTGEQPLDEVNSTQPVVDSGVLGELLGTEDSVMLVKFYSSFLETGRLTLEEFEQAKDAKNSAQIGELGHKLKSSSRTIGADYLADLCTELERAGKQGDMDTIEQQLPKMIDAFNQVRVWVETFQANNG